MRRILLAIFALTAAAPAPHPTLRAIAAEVSPVQLRATIATLVGFGTRHTLSDTQSPTRGIGAARRWAAGRFAAYSAACGGCLAIETPAETFVGDRLPRPADIVDVLAVQRGTSDPDRVVIISGHIDSRNSDAMDATADAPGANDDGSGTAAVLEAARVLSKRKFAATIVYAVLSGEEQGLYGGKLLAETAVKKGWQVEAVLNNDIVGNTHGSSGVVDAAHVRVFSEGTRATETPAEADQRRYSGGEVDSPSRQLARFIDSAAADVPGLTVTMVYRTDRYSRGGDQVPMLKAGYPAVRITEATENYDRQHQNVRVEGGRAYGDVLAGVDFPYLAQVTRLNTVSLAALASAPPPPLVTIEGAVKPDTLVRWHPLSGAASYRVWWRSTTAPRWEHSRAASAGATSLALPGVVIDDWFFGVSAVSADGYESPVAFPSLIEIRGPLSPGGKPSPQSGKADVVPR